MKINPDTLSHEQLVLLARHGKEFFDVVVASNNQLLARLAGRTDISESALDILNQWTAAMNQLAEASSAAVAGIVQERSGKLN